MTTAIPAPSSSSVGPHSRWRVYAIAMAERIDFDVAVYLRHPVRLVDGEKKIGLGLTRPSFDLWPPV